ncbi:hypothetical protein ACE1CD_20930 [Aerosakkonema sp. BLCC-F183]|uniref:hypothetical protein n=1 Tax=Aerosakkonema sp. BLCC-F183 TaxID=3342834 RepID=UPI0035BAD8D0
MNGDEGWGVGCLILIGIVALYWGIGWLSILIFNNQGWVALIGAILIVISIILGIFWYRLKQKAVTINEISKKISDNWK